MGRGDECYLPAFRSFYISLSLLLDQNLLLSVVVVVLLFNREHRVFLSCYGAGREKGQAAVYENSPSIVMSAQIYVAEGQLSFFILQALCL